MWNTPQHGHLPSWWKGWSLGLVALRVRGEGCSGRQAMLPGQQVFCRVKKKRKRNKDELELYFGETLPRERGRRCRCRCCVKNKELTARETKSVPLGKIQQRMRQSRDSHQSLQGPQGTKRPIFWNAFHCKLTTLRSECRIHPVQVRWVTCSVCVSEFLYKGVYKWIHSKCISFHQRMLLHIL